MSGGGPSVAGMNNDPVVIDCDSCLVRSASACGDCVVTVLLGAPPQGVSIDAEERAAFDALADQGLVPPLRLITPLPSIEEAEPLPGAADPDARAG